MRDLIMRRMTPAAVVLVFAIAVAIASAADARPVRQFSVHNWRGNVFVDDQTGRFSHCAALARYRSGVTLLFSLNRQMQWALGFSSRSWKLNPSQSYDVAYQIDDGPLRQETGQAISRGLVRIVLPDDLERVNEFRSGKMLTVTAGNETVKFNLTDAGAMLTELNDCVAKSRDLVVAAPDLFGPSQSESKPDAASKGDAGIAALREEAAKVAADVIARAGVTDFQFLKGENVPVSIRNHHAVWRAPGMLGTLRILAGLPAATIDQIRAGLVAAGASRCKDKFESGALPNSGETNVLSIFAACQGEKGLAAYHLVLPRHAGGHYIFSLIGRIDAKDALQSANAAYRDAAIEVLRKPQ